MEEKREVIVAVVRLGGAMLAPSVFVIVGLNPTIQIDFYVWIPVFTGMTQGKSL